MTGDWQFQLEKHHYLAGPGLTTMVQLAMSLKRPLLIEGPAGVGKTSLAYAIAAVVERPLIRLQCFEGMDAAQALYDWNYHKQLAHLSQTGSNGTNVFTEEFILERPLLKALRQEDGAVLLIDEVDRTDEAFEALLLEFLSEFQITIPEWDTVKAKQPPIVLLTSNRTRPLSDALRRRCLYVHLTWPTEELEQSIVRLNEPKLPEDVVCSLVRSMRAMRTWDLLKPPGVAESLDWARAFTVAGGREWNLEFMEQTLGCVVKDAFDLELVQPRLPELLWTEP